MILILFLCTLAIGLLAQWHVKRAYARRSRTPVRSGYTGAEAAGEILRQAGISNVSIYEHDELLGDHYDPRHKRLVLSSANYHGTSAAALGVAAHECGHATSTSKAYAPLQLRMAAVCITSFASQLVLWIPLLGAFTGLLAPKVSLLIIAAAWGVLMAFNLITLPVEFDASRRAKLVLAKMGFIQPGPESAAVSQVVNADGLDLRGRVHLVADLFPLALAAALTGEGSPMKRHSTIWRGVSHPRTDVPPRPLLAGGPTLLRQFAENTRMRQILCPNQHVGAWWVGGMPQSGGRQAGGLREAHSG